MLFIINLLYINLLITLLIYRFQSLCTIPKPQNISVFSLFLVRSHSYTIYHGYTIDFTAMDKWTLARPTTLTLTLTLVTWNLVQFNQRSIRAIEGTEEKEVAVESRCRNNFENHGINGERLRRRAYHVAGD